MASTISKCSIVNLRQTLKYLNISFNLDMNIFVRKHLISHYSRSCRPVRCLRAWFLPLCQCCRTQSGVTIMKGSMCSEARATEDLPRDTAHGKWNKEQKNIIYETVCTGQPLTAEDWDKLREAILGATGFITETNIDALVIAACIANRQLAVGTSYLRYLSSAGRSVNMATAGNFLKLCSVCSEEVCVDRQLVLRVYDGLRSACPLLDAGTAQNAILGLALTHRWEESIPLLETVRLTTAPNVTVLSALARAAFNHDKPELGWSMMSEIVAYNKKPLPVAYLAWLDHCAAQDTGRALNLLHQLLHYMSHNGLRPTRDVAQRLKTSYETLSMSSSEWVGTFTQLSHRGMCKSCGKYLPVISLTVEEFEKLREVFMKQVVIGRNVFVKTTPEELEKFTLFLQSSKPYNVVIDGLNVAFSGVKSDRNPRVLAGFVQAVVKHFVAQSKTVLVLGRKHMAKWPPDIMAFVHRNAQVFLAHNLSEDDPFLLYAAMHGGLGTGFVSRDLMRGHAFLLQDAALKSTFRRWQQQHQYQLLYVERNGRVRMKWPLQFNPNVQQASDGSWHIPYDEDIAAQSIESLEPPRSWLCLSKIASFQKK